MSADLRRHNLVVLGPPLSGRSSALVTLAEGLRTSGLAATTTGDVSEPVELCAVGSGASPLRGLDLWDDAAFDREGHADVVRRLADVHLAGGGRGEVRAILFVDAAEDVDGSAELLKRLEQMAKTDAVRLVVASDGATLSRSYTGWLAHLRRNRSALLLQPDGRAEAEALVGIKPDFRPGQEFPPGRGVFVANRRWQLVQVAQSVAADQLRSEGATPLRTAG